MGADTIRGWLHDKDVLVTGGTGYLGKGLIEKLLRTTDVRRIYLIIRSKKDMSPAVRWQQISQGLLFTRLLTENPEALSKVVVLHGDMAERGLALCDNDKKELCNNVAVVFHAAACVRFDDPLSSAILLNVRGTKELLDLVKSMKKLECLAEICSVQVEVITLFCQSILMMGERPKPVDDHKMKQAIMENISDVYQYFNQICFQYVSTAYSTPKLNDDKIDEVLYPQQYDWRTLINIAERDGSLLNILQDKIITVHPNTYTFSKSLAETLILQTADILPVVIFRPSVVIGSLLEPEPGWMDNLNGPMGLACGMATGVLRVMWCKTDIILDIVPVDVAINAMIVTAWVTSNKNSKMFIVYNCTYGDSYQLTYKDMKVNAEIVQPDLPVDNNIWYPFGFATNNNYYYHFLFYTLQILPGWFLDSLLIFFHKKPILTKLNIKIYKAMKALYYFTSQQFQFNNSNYKSVFDLIPSSERDTFDLNFKQISKLELLTIFQKGMKKFLLKEKEEDLDEFKAKYWRHYYVHTFTKGIVLAGISWFLMSTFIW